MATVEFDADCMTEQKPGKRWRREVEAATMEYLEDAGMPFACAEILLSTTGCAWLHCGDWMAPRTDDGPQFLFLKALGTGREEMPSYLWTMRRKLVKAARQNRLRRGQFARLP